jgi:hypothetical protein
VSVAGQPVEATYAFTNGRLAITLKRDITVTAGQKLEIVTG